jgi:hypothetical protein
MCRVKINHQRDVQCAFSLGPLARMAAVFLNWTNRGDGRTEHGPKKLRIKRLRLKRKTWRPTTWWRNRTGQPYLWDKESHIGTPRPQRWNSQSPKVKGLDLGFSWAFQVEGLDPRFLYVIHKHQVKISRFFIGHIFFLWFLPGFINP